MIGMGRVECGGAHYRVMIVIVVVLEQEKEKKALMSEYKCYKLYDTIGRRSCLTVLERVYH